MIEVENTDVNIVRNLIPMRNHMPASAYGLKAISDWFLHNLMQILPLQKYKLLKISLKFENYWLIGFLPLV